MRHAIPMLFAFSVIWMAAPSDSDFRLHTSFDLAVQDSTRCPLEATYAFGTVEQLLGDSVHVAATDSDGVGISDVRLLVDSLDASICDSIRVLRVVAADTNYVDTYYSAETQDKTRYFVARTPLPPPATDSVIVIHYGLTAITVYDETFNDLGGFAW